MHSQLTANFDILPLQKAHNKNSFSCGVPSLDHYLHKQATQDMRRNISVSYVLVDTINGCVVGYFTLSSTTIQLCNLPDDASKKLPQYPLIPATLIGRLAIDNKYQKQGFGAILLLDGLSKAFQASQTIASFAVIVEAIDVNAAAFYGKYGFIPLLATQKKLYLPMKLVGKI